MMKELASLLSLLDRKCGRSPTCQRALCRRWLHAKLKTLACRCPNLDSEGALQGEVIKGFASRGIESMRWQSAPSKLIGGLTPISQRQPSMKLILEWGEGVPDYMDSWYGFFCECGWFSLISFPKVPTIGMA
jgi:hypothetical protein